MSLCERVYVHMYLFGVLVQPILAKKKKCCINDEDNNDDDIDDDGD